MIEITPQQLMTIVAQAVTLGRTQHMADMTPSKDTVGRLQAKAILQSRGLPVSLLKTWEDKGILTYTQTTEHSKRKYKMTDLQELILCTTIAR